MRGNEFGFSINRAERPNVAKLLDEKMRNLDCKRLELDEIWGFIGKKMRHVKEGDDPTFGDVWTFCAIDAETKLVPSHKVGKRDYLTATAFVSDVASRLRTARRFPAMVNAPISKQLRMLSAWT